MILFGLASSCLTVSGVSEDVKQELRSKGYPIAIVDYSTAPPNSAGGVDVKIIWQNVSSKSIKYAVFEVRPYNRVGDLTPSEIGGKTMEKLQQTGPFPPGEIAGRTTYWENVWWNHSISSMKIRAVRITYMDGTSKKFLQDEVRDIIIY